MGAINVMFVLKRDSDMCVSALRMFLSAGINQVKDLPQNYPCKSAVMEIPSPSDGKEETCHGSDERGGHQIA